MPANDADDAVGTKLGVSGRGFVLLRVEAIEYAGRQNSSGTRTSADRTCYLLLADDGTTTSSSDEEDAARQPRFLFARLHIFASGIVSIGRCSLSRRRSELLMKKVEIDVACIEAKLAELRAVHDHRYERGVNPRCTIAPLLVKASFPEILVEYRSEHGSSDDEERLLFALGKYLTACRIVLASDRYDWGKQAFGREHYRSAHWVVDRDVLSKMLKTFERLGLVTVDWGRRGKHITYYRPTEAAVPLLQSLRNPPMKSVPRKPGQVKHPDGTVHADTKLGGDKMKFDRRCAVVKANQAINEKACVELPTWAIDVWTRVEARYREDLYYIGTDGTRRERTVHTVELLKMLASHGTSTVSLHHLVGQHCSFTDGGTEKGGRIINGFQFFPRELRCCILIDHAPSMEWDFKALYISMCYWLFGVAAPDKPYEIVIDGIAVPRSEIKIAINICLFTNLRQYALLAIHADCTLPKGITPSMLLDAIEAKHRLVKHLFYEDFGHHLQSVEGDATQRILAHYNHTKREIPSIGIHDSFRLPQKAIDLPDVMRTKMKKAVETFSRGKVWEKINHRKEGDTYLLGIRKVVNPGISASRDAVATRIHDVEIDWIKVDQKPTYTDPEELEAALVKRFEQKVAKLKASAALDTRTEANERYWSRAKLNKIVGMTKKWQTEILGEPHTWKVEPDAQYQGDHGRVVHLWLMETWWPSIENNTDAAETMVNILQKRRRRTKAKMCHLVRKSSRSSSSINPFSIEGVDPIDVLVDAVEQDRWWMIEREGAEAA